MLQPLAVEITCVQTTVSRSWSNGDVTTADDNDSDGYDHDSQASALNLPPTTENPGAFYDVANGELMNQGATADTGFCFLADICHCKPFPNFVFLCIFFESHVDKEPVFYTALGLLTLPSASSMESNKTAHLQAGLREEY